MTNTQADDSHIEILRVQLVAGRDEAQGADGSSIEDWAQDCSRDPEHAFHAEAVEFVELLGLVGGGS